MTCFFVLFVLSNFFSAPVLVKLLLAFFLFKIGGALEREGGTGKGRGGAIARRLPQKILQIVLLGRERERERIAMLW